MKNGKWWYELTQRATGCLIHNLNVAQCSRAQASHIYYSCFLLSPTLPGMKIKDPLLDEELRVFGLIFIAGSVVLVFWGTDWQPVKLGIWRNWLLLSWFKWFRYTSRRWAEVHLCAFYYWLSRAHYSILLFWVLYGFVFKIYLYYCSLWRLWLAPKRCRSMPYLNVWYFRLCL